MISALISLTALAMASAADRRSRVRTAIALGDIPDLTELIDARGLKVVADQVNAMSDGSPKEMMMRGIDQWLHRTVWVDSIEKMDGRAKRDLENAKGARITLYRTPIIATTRGQKSRVSTKEYPIKVLIYGTGKRTESLALHDDHYWDIKFRRPHEDLALKAFAPVIVGPSYRVRT